MEFLVTLTGTGLPVPSPGRAGAGTLVQAGEHVLQFDAGRATVLRLSEAGVEPDDIDALFLTHHHSDHCIGVDDLVITRWVNRGQALTVLAPDGPLTRFGEELLLPWSEDVKIRREVTGRGAVELDWTPFPASEVPQEVWSADDVTVTSVSVEHPPVEPAVAYRVDSGGRSVVISGDTRVCAAVEQLARGADLLVHEVCLPEAFVHGADRSIISYHADAYELGALADRAGVQALMLTHLLPAPRTPDDEERYVRAVREGGYTGRLIVGRDLSAYDLVEGAEVT